MTDTSARRIAAAMRRVRRLEDLLGEAIKESDCDWNEVVTGLGFALIAMVDANPNERMRVAMAAQLAGRLELAARVRGSFGIRGKMQ